MKRKGYDMVRYDNLFVVLMGMGVVFFGLICIILLTMAMGKVLQPRKELTAVKEAAKGNAGKGIRQRHPAGDPGDHHFGTGRRDGCSPF